MGRIQRRALTLTAALVAAPNFAAAEELSITASAGSPFTAIDARYTLTSSLAATARASLVETHAVRFGAGARLSLAIDPELTATTELTVLRAIGLDAVSTWDVELVEELALELDDGALIAALRAGAIGYLGPEPSQRGILALAALRASTSPGPNLIVGVDLGWITSRTTGRPLAAIFAGYAF